MYLSKIIDVESAARFFSYPSIDFSIIVDLSDFFLFSLQIDI